MLLNSSRRDSGCLRWMECFSGCWCWSTTCLVAGQGACACACACARSFPALPKFWLHAQAQAQASMIRGSWSCTKSRWSWSWQKERRECDAMLGESKRAWKKGRGDVDCLETCKDGQSPRTILRGLRPCAGATWTKVLWVGWLVGWLVD
jgi:hypothetical protein